MAVLFYGVEVEILDNLDASDRDGFMKEAAQAYRNRAATLAALGQRTAAEKDRRHADKLDAEAKQIAARSSKEKTQTAAASAPPPGFGQVQFVNAFGQPATVILDGISYALQAGEKKVVAKPAGGFTVQLPGGTPARGEVVEGKMVTIRVVPESGRP